MPPRRNLELKARYADLDAAAARVREFGARDAGEEIQTDTYFHVKNGRLKLRVINDHSAVLIAYERPDHIAARLSHYHLIPVPDGETLLAALTVALGVRGEVRKRRHIWLWHNVRIHLDQVAGLGTFIELEAVISAPEDDATAQPRLDELTQMLAIPPNTLIAASYSDLLGL